MSGTSNPTGTAPASRKVLCWNVNFGTQSRPFYLFDTQLGQFVVREVLSGKSYPRVPLAGPVRTILDIGANIGAASVYFALNYPEARIFSFEPSPTCYELLTRNIAGVTTISGFPFGLSDRTETVSLYLGEHDEVTNSIGRSQLNSAANVPVQLRAGAEVLRELRIDEIDILKLDTEGHELPILQALAPWLSRTALIYLEYHDAQDRIAIDRMLTGTHVLCLGRISDPHRGELCYVDPRRMSASSNWERLQIRR